MGRDDRLMSEFIGLLDVDSKIPNLALMKLSQHHKSLGHEVEMYQPLFIEQKMIHMT